jgi:acyl-CoA synthetase (AMP-forming)/AMP-acid ligase II
MNKIITRDWIKDGSMFYARFNEEENKDEFCLRINYWKERLLEEGAVPGNKIGILLISSDINFIALMFASFELGLKLVPLHRPNSEKECQKPKSNAHLPLDILVLFSWQNHSLLTIPEMHFSENSKKIINYSHDDWHIESKKCISPISTPVLCQPSDDIILCNSSGTTSTPKLINHTHEYLYDLGKFLVDHLELKEDDTVFHPSSINHGGSLSVYFFPTLLKCKNHYFHLSVDKTENVDDIHAYFAECMEKYNITKILSPDGFFTDNLIQAIDKMERGLPNATMIILTFINPKWLDVVKKGKLKKIISVFGCSETGGGLFLPYIDKDTVDFDPKFLRKPTTGFFDIKEVNGMLTVTLPNGNVVETEDIVEEKDEGFYFVRKNRLKKINDVEINPLDIVQLLEDTYSRNRFEIVVDEIRNMLYIVTDDKAMASDGSIKDKVDKFYMGNVTLNRVIYMPEFGYATVAIKPDREKLLEYINEKVDS